MGVLVSVFYVSKIELYADLHQVCPKMLVEEEKKGNVKAIEYI